MESKVERKPDEHWVWGKATETVANILLLCVSVPVLVVMLAWMVHQLVAMGV